MKRSSSSFKTLQFAKKFQDFHEMDERTFAMVSISGTNPELRFSSRVEFFLLSRYSRGKSVKRVNSP